MVRCSEHPTASVEVDVAAPPAAVWPLVSDSTLSLKLSGPLAAREDALARMVDLVGDINREQPG